MKKLFRAALLGSLIVTHLPATADEAMSETQAALGGGGRPVGEAYSRSPVYGANGMVATAHPLASQAALDVMKAGGSALDGAIAANAALGLMEPTGNGIGGDIFIILWDPKTQKLYGYNGSGRSPMKRSLDELKRKIQAMRDSGRLGDEFKGIPPLGSLPVTVPGTVDGWFATHERFGKLPMSEVLAPAVRYANEGFPVSPVIAYYFERNRQGFLRNEGQVEELENARALWFQDGIAPAAGEIFKNPDLGKTLTVLGEDGRDAFYKGELAKTMADYMTRIGGDMSYEDLAAHEGEWVKPGHVNYKGYDVYELPPNGQGYAALQMLNILENVDLAQWPRGSAEVFHYMVEAKRLAFEDVAAYYADPAFGDQPLEELLTKEYGKARFALIDADKAQAQFGPGEPKLEGEGDTTYLTVADKDGMMVSLIQSNYRGMGSGLVPDGLGFMLQDRGELFSLDPEHPNAYEPGKRPFHTIIPAFVMKDGEPLMSFGLMGGSMQPQGHVQILVNIIDYGMNVQEAGDAARFNHDGGSQPTGIHRDPLGTIYVEAGVSTETIQALEAMGHKVEVDTSGVRFGGYQAIMRSPDGVYAGATEMRKDGTVTAW
ncbi:gamma-glutamyltransferase [Parahalioglobus pacificus]|uniref:Glutathione hydrolase proenzyme n=1 Tax=Parahalioglobus pacificus TaxID=930806 RepID=A0A918XMG0_9GAMM|nr:gamma-glutamyltransferase [Halioglobus pacificus]GHD39146.1 gamma-glutamyltranspeptidase [Halioglobus pacificus]